MDLEQKLEGRWAWPFAVIMCALIVGVMILAAQINHPPAPPAPAVSSGIRGEGAAPVPTTGAESGVPSGKSPATAGPGAAGSAPGSAGGR